MDLEEIGLSDEVRGTSVLPRVPDEHAPPSSPRCRYLTDDTLMGRCPGIAVELPSPIRLCARHLSAVIVTLRITAI